jgi:hypothetical protein
MMREMEGKRVALWITRRAPARGVEMAVIGGTIRIAGGVLVLDRGPSQHPMVLDDELLERFREPPVFMRALFGDAELVLPVSVSRIPADADYVIPFWYGSVKPNRN